MAGTPAASKGWGCVIILLSPIIPFIILLLTQYSNIIYMSEIKVGLKVSKINLVRHIDECFHNSRTCGVLCEQ